MLEAISIALSTLFSFQGMLMVCIGAIVGLLFGIIPGLGASQAMILLLPFTYAMDAQLAIVMFVAIMATASFGGSLPAILINTPGTPANVCTTFDGYPMATRGEAVRAIYISAASCMIGTTIGALVLLTSVPFMISIISIFKSPEKFWLIVFGLAMISLAAKGNALKGLVAGGIGILISFIGRNYVFPGERFTGGISFLYDGVPLVAFLVGMFAISPLIFMGIKTTIVENKGVGLKSEYSAKSQAWQAMKDVYHYKWQALRGSAIGVFLGIIPAVGGAAANFINYLFSKQVSKESEEYGKGSAEGLIASETSNDAKDGGALIPTLAFGIPGDNNTAILLGALIMHGVGLGFNLFNYNLDMVALIILALVFGQIAVSIIGLSLAGGVSKVTNINTYYIVPVVMIFSFIGAYLFRGNIWDAMIVTTAAILAYGLTLFNYPVICIVLGYMLGVEAERTFVMALKTAQGSYGVFFQSITSWVIILLIVSTFVTTTLATGRKQKKEAQMNNTITSFSKNWLGFSFSIILILITLGFFVASLTYDRQMSLFPLILSIVTLVLLVIIALSEIFPRMNKFAAKFGGDLEEFAGDNDKEEKVTLGLIKKHMKIIFWLLLISVAVVIFGFMVFPLFIFAYIISFDKSKWLFGLIMSLFILAVILAMAFIPSVVYWAGVIPEIIPDILGGGIISRFW